MAWRRPKPTKPKPNRCRFLDSIPFSKASSKKNRNKRNLKQKEKKEQNESTSKNQTQTQTQTQTRSMDMALLRSPLNPLFFHLPWIPRPLRLAASSSFASPLPSHPAIARASAFRTHLFLVSPAAAPIPQCSRMTLAPPPPPTSRSSMASRIFKDLQVDSSANYSSETQHTALKNHLNRFPSPVSLVSGASRGIGFEFVRSTSPSITHVFCLFRPKT